MISKLILIYYFLHPHFNDLPHKHGHVHSYNKAKGIPDCANPGSTEAKVEA